MKWCERRHKGEVTPPILGNLSFLAAFIGSRLEQLKPGRQTHGSKIQGNRQGHDHDTHRVDFFAKIPPTNPATTKVVKHTGGMDWPAMARWAAPRAALVALTPKFCVSIGPRKGMRVFWAVL